MECKGLVLDTKDSEVLVKVVRQGSCGENCGMCKGCSQRSVEVFARCDLTVKKGDFVFVYTPTKLVLLALSLVFLLPVLLPVFVYILLFDFGEVISIICAISILIIILVAVFLLSRSRRFVDVLKPKVISIIK